MRRQDFICIMADAARDSWRSPLPPNVPHKPPPRHSLRAASAGIINHQRSIDVARAAVRASIIKATTFKGE